MVSLCWTYPPKSLKASSNPSMPFSVWLGPGRSHRLKHPHVNLGECANQTHKYCLRNSLGGQCVRPLARVVHEKPDCIYWHNTTLLKRLHGVASISGHETEERHPSIRTRLPIHDFLAKKIQIRSSGACRLQKNKNIPCHGTTQNFQNRQKKLVNKGKTLNTQDEMLNTYIYSRDAHISPAHPHRAWQTCTQVSTASHGVVCTLGVNRERRLCLTSRVWTQSPPLSEHTRGVRVSQSLGRGNAVAPTDRRSQRKRGRNERRIGYYDSSLWRILDCLHRTSYRGESTLKQVSCHFLEFAISVDAMLVSGREVGTWTA